MTESMKNAAGHSPNYSETYSGIAPSLGTHPQFFSRSESAAVEKGHVLICGGYTQTDILFLLTAGILFAES